MNKSNNVIVLKTLYLLMPVTLYLTLVWVPAAYMHGESSRLLYFHVPLAWVSVLAFFVSGFYSIQYLRDKTGTSYLLEEKAHNSAVIGFFFAVLATIIGAIWARIMWGAFWNWNPRQISIVILLLIYMAYFSLRVSLEHNPQRGRIISAYLIFAMVTVPFFVFVLPRLYEHSLHPDTIINQERKMHLGGPMKITLMISIFTFTVLYAYIVNLMNRISGLTHIIEERDYEDYKIQDE